MRKPKEKPVVKPVKISFCTTCMGRTAHLQDTLIQNIKDNLPENPGDPEVEFVLVDYNSQDGLKEWVEGNAELQDYIKRGILIYARNPEPAKFHHAHAKNMAHRIAAENADKADKAAAEHVDEVATEHIVCNLDADNFTGKGFARYLADEFADGKRAIIHPAYGAHKDLPDGYWGRIALRLEDFIAIGGYSETRFKNGWGGEDSDFIVRALAYGLEPRPIFNKDFLHVIGHDNEKRVENTLGGTTVQEIERAYSGGKTLKDLGKTFARYALSVQANRIEKFGNFGMGTVFGIGNEPWVIKAIKPFPRISGRGARAIVPLIKDIRMTPIKKDKAMKKKPAKNTAVAKDNLIA